MNFRNAILIHLFLLLGISSSHGQNTKHDIFHDTDGNTWHQLFLDFKAKEIIDIKYSTDSLPVEGKLSVDGFSVIIKNYPGDKSVKVKLKDESGQEREITKSRCFIDPIILEL